MAVDAVHDPVVDGMAGEWHDNLDPWRTTIKGERVYGRGTADNMGQHSINMSALRMVRVKPKHISYTGADRAGFKIEV